MSEPIITSLTPANLHEILQQAGYRAELMTNRPNAPYLRSATGGIPFEVQFVNRMPGDADTYADICFVVVLRLQGEMPLTVVNDWNNSRRFARLRLVQDMAVLDLDLSAVGGLTHGYLRAQIGLWEQLVQGLVPFLRDAFIKIAGANSAPQGAAVVAPPADADPVSQVGVSA
jgi:hypothetical protein